MPAMPTRLCRWLAQGARAAGVFHLGQHPLGGRPGSRSSAAWRGRRRQWRSRSRPTGGIHQAALDAARWRQTRLCRNSHSAPASSCRAQRHRLEGLAGKAARKCASSRGRGQPGRGVEAAVGWAAAAPPPPHAPPAAAPRRRRNRAAPSCRRPAPAAPRGARRRGSPGGGVEAQRARRRPAGPAVAHMKAHPRPGWRRRCSQARSSGAAFMSVGKTRCELPTKVSTPRPAAQARRFSGPKAREQWRRCCARLAVARGKASNGSAWVRLSPPLPASRNLRPTEGMASNRCTAPPAPARRPGRQTLRCALSDGWPLQFHPEAPRFSDATRASDESATRAVPCRRLPWRRAVWQPTHGARPARRAGRQPARRVLAPASRRAWQRPGPLPSQPVWFLHRFSRRPMAPAALWLQFLPWGRGFCWQVSWWQVFWWRLRWACCGSRKVAVPERSRQAAQRPAPSVGTTTR
jgi:hypothetical protein